ncbi:MAG: VCBS repeat-containing protein [Byssovorax sp.]
MVATLVAAGDARADWPVSRHDAKRTGVTGGKSDITKPIVAWSAYLGGSLAATSMRVHDIDGDGKGEIIVCNGGVVSAKRADDKLLWATRILATGFLGGIEDLDGDGKPEVIAYTRQGAWVLDITTGAVLWSQPQGEMGAAAYLRLADMTGDGRLDVMMTECGGCGASKPQTGFIYSFPTGFGSPVRTELGPIEGATAALTIVKPDPNAPADVLVNASSSTLALLDGKTGKTLAVSPSIGAPIAWSTVCLPGDIDGVPGEELVCVASDSPSPSPVAGDIRKVFALKYKGGPAPSLAVLWIYNVPAGEALSNTGNEPLVDLDGDGKYEVIVTGHHADDSYSMHLLDAATGAELTKVDGERFAGSAPLESPVARTTLTYAAGNTTAWAYNGLTKKLIKRWQVNDRYPLPEPDWDRSRISSAAITRPLTVDLDGDGILDLITAKASPGPPQIDGYVTSTGPTAVIDYASLTFSKSLGPIGFWSVAPVDLGAPQLAVAEVDGTLHFLDHKLQPTASVVRFGGYYAPGGWEDLGRSPVIASVGGAAQAIFARDSRSRLLRLDASKATPSVAPVEVWSLDGASSPIVVPGLLGGKAGLAAIYSDYSASPQVHAVLSMDPANGSVVWSSPIPAGAFNDILPGDFNLDGTPDIAVQWPSAAGDQLITAGLSGTSGAQLWSFGAVAGDCGLQSAGIALADWNGDGIDDVLQVMPNIRADSGKDGSLIAKSDVHPCYFLPTPVDTNKDGVDELVLHGGAVGVVVFGHDLNTPLYQSTDDDKPFPYGAIAACPSGPVLVEGSLRNIARLKMTALSTSTVITRVLAGGATFADEAAATAAKAPPGQLTSTSIHANLRGDGRPVALVGSTDGFLYAIDPCTGDLVFSKDFGFNVGEIIFGDSDGDGLDEILVSVADGNLYALKNDPSTMMGTGGAGGTGSTTASSTTGVGGAGGAGGDGPTPTLQHFPLYGRAGCYCAVPTGPAHDDPALLLLAGAVVIAVRRRRAR